MPKVKIIAEAGVNHNGSLSLAKELVDVAVDAGADIVKFQTYVTEELVAQLCELAEYQQENTSDVKNQYQLLKELELSFADFVEINSYCKTRNISFMSSPFDRFSLEFLTNDIACSTIKLGSGEITNAQLLFLAAAANVNIILSTGMSTLEEVENALSILSFAYHYQGRPPKNLEECKRHFNLIGCDNNLINKVTLLHCTSQYPAPLASANLLSISALKQEWPLAVGFSDHTEGSHAAVIAVALGAAVVEKHFTLDVSMEGPDHRASASPEEFKRYVDQIRLTELAMGECNKAAQSCEESTKKYARKSIVARCDIRKGEIFSRDNISVMRSGSIDNAIEYWDVVGSCSEHYYRTGDIIQRDFDA